VSTATLAEVVLTLGEQVAAVAPEATGTACVDVPPQAWRVVAEHLLAAGAGLDWLTGVDLGPEPDGEVAVVALFSADEDSVLVRTTVGYQESLPTLSDVCPSAPWHERETAEMLGVSFDGGDPRRLLLPSDVSGFPLRRSYPLQPRLDTPWPGDSGGRRSRVPGVNPQWQR